MSDNPIYDQMIRERGGHIPGTFTLEELTELENLRRLLNLPPRLALMGGPVSPVGAVVPARRITPIKPVKQIRTLREKALSSEETQEINSAELATAQ